jgi:diguanylate cyclase (GGDEF)-like protein
MEAIFIAMDTYGLGFHPGYVVFLSYYGSVLFIVSLYVVLIYSYVFLYEKVLLVSTQAKDYKKLSEVDELTGALNRRVLHTLVREISGHVCVMFVDIDHFKSINDTYGHAVGDKVLQLVAAAIKSHLRSGDYLIRYGGEEFLILLQHVSPKVAQKIAERLRRATEDENIKVDASTHINLTVSVGLCCDYISPDDMTGKLWYMIVKADEKMYEAKQRGRNMVVSCQ